LLRDGEYQLRLGFAGEKLSEPVTLVWHSQTPLVTAEISKPAGASTVTISARVASKIPVDHAIFVELLLDLSRTPAGILLPASRAAADSAGFAIFNFRMVVPELPKILPGEIGFAQPFFGLAVIDPAGNRYEQEESYAWFIASGQKRLSSKPAGPGKMRTERKSSRLVLSPATAANQAVQAEPAELQLKATRVAEGTHQLEWGQAPAAAGQALSLVWRDDQPIAICFNHHYLDEEAPPNQTCTYRLELLTRSGRVHRSNIVRLELATKRAEAAHEAQPLFAQAFGPEVAAASTAANSLRDQTAIAAVVFKHKPAIQDCYLRELRRNFSLKGKVVVRFIVTPQGNVANAEIVSSTLNNESVEDCMLDRIKRWNDFGPGLPKEKEAAYKQTYLFGY